MGKCAIMHINMDFTACPMKIPLVQRKWKQADLWEIKL